MLTFWLVRRIMDMKPGRVVGREGAERASRPSREALAFGSLEALGLALRDRDICPAGDCGSGDKLLSLLVFGAVVSGDSLKMWIVSVALETQRRVLVALKDMQWILAGMEPRRNW